MYVLSSQYVYTQFKTSECELSQHKTNQLSTAWLTHLDNVVAIELQHYPPPNLKE